jgi:hypothetical protein
MLAPFWKVLIVANLSTNMNDIGEILVVLAGVW